ILPRSVRQRPSEFLVFIGKLVVCIVLMTVGIIFLKYIWTLFFTLNRFNCLVFVSLSIIVGAALFIGCALKSHLFTQEEWETLPG
ncbi:polysaccharide biosynthesis protein, partial [Lactiplantibacillus pentosus]